MINDIDIVSELVKSIHEEGRKIEISDIAAMDYSIVARNSQFANCAEINIIIKTHDDKYYISTIEDNYVPVPESVLQLIEKTESTMN